MKTTLAILAAAAVLTGCSSTDPRSFAPLHRVDTITTQTVYTVVVDDSTGAITTNAATGLRTASVYTVSAPLSAAVETAATVASAAPVPWGGLVSTALSLALAGLGWFARVKSKQAGLLDVVIAGVEKANSPEVKAAIATVADLAGVKSQLHNQVKRVTE